jgi:hypothetical protein
MDNDTVERARFAPCRFEERGRTRTITHRQAGIRSCIGKDMVFSQKPSPLLCFSAAACNLHLNRLSSCPVASCIHSAFLWAFLVRRLVHYSSCVSLYRSRDIACRAEHIYGVNTHGRGISSLCKNFLFPYGSQDLVCLHLYWRCIVVSGCYCDLSAKTIYGLIPAKSHLPRKLFNSHRCFCNRPIHSTNIMYREGSTNSRTRSDRSCNGGQLPMESRLLVFGLSVAT